MFVWKIETQ